MKKSKHERNRAKRAAKKKALRTQNNHNPKNFGDQGGHADEIKRAVELDSAQLFYAIDFLLTGGDIIPGSIRSIMRSSAQEPHRYPLTNVTYKISEFMSSSTFNRQRDLVMVPPQLEWQPTSRWKPWNMDRTLLLGLLPSARGTDRQTLERMLLLDVLVAPISQVVPRPTASSWPFADKIGKGTDPIAEHFRDRSNRLSLMLEVTRAVAAREYPLVKAVKEAVTSASSESGKPISTALLSADTNSELKTRKKIDGFLSVIFLRELLTNKHDKELGQRWVACLGELLIWTSSAISTADKRATIQDRVTELLPKLDELLSVTPENLRSEEIILGWSGVFSLIREQFSNLFQISISRKTQFSEVFQQLKPFLKYQNVLHKIFKLDAQRIWLIAATNRNYRMLSENVDANFGAESFPQIILLQNLIDHANLSYRERLLVEVAKLRFSEYLQPGDLKIFSELDPHVFPANHARIGNPFLFQLNRIFMLFTTGVPKSEQFFARSVLKELCVFFESRINLVRSPLKEYQPLLERFIDAFPGRFCIELYLCMLGAANGSVRKSQQKRLAHMPQIEGVSSEAARAAFRYILLEGSDLLWDDFLELIFTKLSFETQKMFIISAAERSTARGMHGSAEKKIWERLHKLVTDARFKISSMVRSRAILDPQILALALYQVPESTPERHPDRHRINRDGPLVEVTKPAGTLSKVESLITSCGQILRGLRWLVASTRLDHWGDEIRERTINGCIGQLLTEEAIKQGSLEALSLLLQLRPNPAQERTLLLELKAREANPDLVAPLIDFYETTDYSAISKATATLFGAARRRLQGRVAPKRTGLEKDTRLLDGLGG